MMAELQKLKTDISVASSEPPAAVQTFQSMAFTDLWEEAGMTEVVHYLRENRSLAIPPQWRELLPHVL